MFVLFVSKSSFRAAFLFSWKIIGLIINQLQNKCKKYLHCIDNLFYICTHKTTKSNIMKAQVKYSNGWTLIIPKYGNATMLFMEWLSKIPAGRNWIHKVNENLDDCFSIRLNMKKEQYEQVAKYINDNL